jgi:hypothetical protein
METLYSTKVDSTAGKSQQGQSAGILAMIRGDKDNEGRRDDEGHKKY